jgi:5-methylcytosine-specific restriction endonuclease McrA
MNTSGDYRWTETKREWKRRFPPNSEGNYICAICKMKVPVEGMSLDHKEETRLRPDLAYSLWNLQPTHSECNSYKSRITLDLEQGKW